MPTTSSYMYRVLRIISEIGRPCSSSEVYKRLLTEPRLSGPQRDRLRERGPEFVELEVLQPLLELRVVIRDSNGQWTLPAGDVVGDAFRQRGDGRPLQPPPPGGPGDNDGDGQGGKGLGEVLGNPVLFCLNEVDRAAAINHALGLSS